MCEVICRKEKVGYLLYDPIMKSIQLEKELVDKSNYRIISPQKIATNTLMSPITVFLEITKRCNLFCSHCFRDYNDRTDLSTKEWCDIIDELYKNGVCTVKITGGEPFLRTDLNEIINRLEKRHINYIVYTNGFYIEKSIAWLKKLQYLDVVRVSIDGLSQINDSIRGKGAWTTAINSIKLLLFNKIPCEINYTITMENYKDLPKLSQYLIDNKIDVQIHTGFIKYAGNAMRNSSQCFFDNESLYKVASQIKKYEEQRKNITELTLLKPIYYELFGKTFGCPAGRTSMIIKQDGTVLPCGILPKDQFNCGNILYDSFLKIWDCPNMLQFGNLSVLEGCKQCPNLFKNCTGGCRGNSFNVFNSINSCDINCSVYKVFENENS